MALILPMFLAAVKVISLTFGSHHVLLFTPKPKRIKKIYQTLSYGLSISVHFSVRSKEGPKEGCLLPIWAQVCFLPLKFHQNDAEWKVENE